MSSETLDFTDYFKSSSLISKSSISDCNNVVEVQNNCYKMCGNLSTNEDDVKGWIKNRLTDLQINIDDGQLNSTILDCIYVLLKERQHLQEQSKAMSLDFASIMSQLEMGHREKESLLSQLLVMKQDLNTANGKMSALKNEHRELRCQWLAEKSELESRCFQSQALQTQYQGTMRKKEKEFEKLQSQLTKTIKDGQRSQKAIITVSKPLQRMSTQAKPLTLRDAELLASKDNIMALENENSNLRLVINDLTANLGSFQAKMTSLLAYQMPSVQVVPQIKCEVTSVEATQEENQKPTNNILPLIPSSIDKLDERLDIVSENDSKLNFLPNTNPALTPARRIVKQADSTAKKLRQEAEILFLARNKNNKKVDGDDNYGNIHSQPLFLQEKDTVAGSGDGDEDIDQLRKQLQEALAVIQEQDWLIHAALVGKLPCKTLQDHNTLENCWSDGEEDNNYTRLRSSRKSTGSVRRLSVGSMYSSSSSPGSPFMIDFLPPASPETRRILEEAGWPLPASSSTGSIINLSATKKSASDEPGQYKTQVNEKLLHNEDPVVPVTVLPMNDLQRALGLE